MFWSFCLASTSVSRIADKVMNEFVGMKLLSEVYIGPRNNLINFRDDPDYDPESGSGLQSVLHGEGL